MGTNGAAGHVVEYAGPVIEGLSMEGRMTICNMTIEGGGRAGMVAPDETTFEWIDGRPGAPEDFDAAARRGASCAPTTARRSTRRSASTPPRCRRSSPGARTPPRSSPVTEHVPEPRTDTEQRALKYMALEPGTAMTDIRLDRVFIGSCTNSRIGDLRAAAQVVDGRKVAADVNAMVVPAPSRSARRPRPRASTRCSAPPDSTGARRAARCASG